jgi:hypothetical protein
MDGPTSFFFRGGWANYLKTYQPLMVQSNSNDIVDGPYQVPRPNDIDDFAL